MTSTQQPRKDKGRWEKDKVSTNAAIWKSLPLSFARGPRCSWERMSHLYACPSLPIARERKRSLALGGRADRGVI
jgi:hypothetical protein